MPTYHGSCHCGRVRFEVEARPTALSECNCSICSAKAALYIPVKEIVGFRITAGESELTGYRFNTMTAVHYFCRHCGIHTFHRPRRDPSLWSVNARCLEDLDISSLPIRRIDGRNREATAKILDLDK
ncbi:MAG: GFA family protein [Pseudomonadota bacterium]|jgi:Uncharacterized conserved protein|nr:MAG: type I-B CRISPR-associated protein Cas8b1/Cst1 [Pseudomonadota bacterium]